MCIGRELSDNCLTVSHAVFFQAFWFACFVFLKECCLLPLHLLFSEGKKLSADQQLRKNKKRERKKKKPVLLPDHNFKRLDAGDYYYYYYYFASHLWWFQGFCKLRVQLGNIMVLQHRESLMPGYSRK